MPKFRKKPVVVEAMQIEADDNNRNSDGSESFLDPNRASIAKVSGWMLGHGFSAFRVVGNGPFGLSIETLEGPISYEPGWWIIRGVQGEFYGCKAEVFAETYEPVKEPPRGDVGCPRCDGTGVIEEAHDGGTHPVHCPCTYSWEEQT